MLSRIVAIALAAASGAGRAPAFTPPIPDPKVGSLEALVTSNDYPQGSLERGEQGTVRVDLHIDSNGAVSRCAVEASSGFPELDSKTCEVLAARAKFRPARNARGRAVPSEYVRSVSWRLADEAMPSDAWGMTMTTALGSDGKPTSCVISLHGAIPSSGERTMSCPTGQPAPSLPTGTASLALITEFNPGPASPVVLRPGDSVVARGVADIQVDAAGNVASCKTVERAGAFADGDLCDISAGTFRPRPGPDGKPAPFAATMALTIIAQARPAAAGAARP